jgi:hypothetical protein
MKRDSGVTDIDPQSWQVAILPLPKRFSRGMALGFCGGHAVGRAEALRGGSVGCWWSGGQPELLALAGHKEVAAGGAAGELIAGQWKRSKSGAMGAVVWTLRDGALEGANRHEPAYERSWATGAGGGAVVGVGRPPGKLGQRARSVGLVWQAGGAPAVVSGAGDVQLFATDGTRVAGSVDGHATLWPSPAATPIELAPAAMPASEVQALDGELQIGIVWKGMCARAAFWRGTAASFVDLTPAGIQTARALGAAQGYQVGFVRTRDNTRNGNAGCDNRAVLWQGAADRWVDLNALLPADKYNASTAWAIDIRGDSVRICGEASRYEADRAGTPQESHFVPVAHPVLWTARLM